MNDTTPSQQRSSIPTFLAGALGGLIVLVLGAALIATDVIDTGDETTRVVRESIPTRDVSDSGDGGRTVADIYKREGAGVVFVVAQRESSSGDSPFGIPDGGDASGSGFVVDKQGTVITNAHVVGDSDDVQVRFEEDGD